MPIYYYDATRDRTAGVLSGLIKITLKIFRNPFEIQMLTKLNCVFSELRIAVRTTYVYTNMMNTE